jgi:hypothetical protein
MASANFEVTYYRARLGNGALSGGTISVVGYIACFDAAANWTYTYTIYFMPDGASLAEPFYDPSRKVGASFRPISQWAMIIDILRNEKPVYALMYDSKPDQNSLLTGQEPVGEGE